MTAEIKKGRYVYYHCTRGRGVCGDTYVREEDLSRLLADVVKRIQVPIDVATGLPKPSARARATKSSITGRP